MIYEWKSTKQYPVDPQIAGERIEAIRVRSNGYLTPRAIVDDARPEDSPLHGCFDWDDTEAAERWREQQARGVIGAIVTVMPEHAEGPSVRAFVNVRVEQQQAYTSTAVALSDEDLRQQVLARAMTELRTLMQRYRELEELADVFAAVDRLTSEGLA